MSAPPPLRWWGWGERRTEVPAGLAALLADELRLDVATLGQPTRPPALPGVTAPDIDPALLRTLGELCGTEAVDVSDDGRLRHAAGRSYLDLLRLRSGDAGDVPDAVVHVADATRVQAVLLACAAADCAVVPFGGGTSVVGGVTPLRGAHRSVITLSLRRLNRLLGVDPVALTATLQAGMTGPEVEAALAGRGLTLGHFPQSFEYATIGGFAATRSAGQASSGYGRFDELVVALRCVGTRGELFASANPTTAAGPSLEQLLLGSEGRFGVITEVTVRVRRRPRGGRYEAWSFRTLDAGIACLRATAQARVTPDVARLSDAAETRVGMAMTAHGGVAEAAGRRYLGARGHGGGCVLIVGWDSDAAAVAARRRDARRIIRRHGGIHLGRAPGNAWRRGRYAAPYLRDSLLDSGVLVETLETATPWSNLAGLRDAVAASLRVSLTDEGVAPLVGAHISHVYPSGASLYFTVLARPGADPAQRWREAKASACATILDNGGTITHHHAVGTEHRAYMVREVGAIGVAALQALARELDPEGIMNPGKLLPD